MTRAMNERDARRLARMPRASHATGAGPLPAADEWTDLEEKAKAASEARKAYLSNEDEALDHSLCVTADEALEALDEAAQPYEDTLLKLIAAARQPRRQDSDQP